MDKNIFKVGMLKLSSLYGKVLSQDMTLVYWDALNDLTDDQFGWAIDGHIKDPVEGIYFPKPAHLIKQIKGTPDKKKAAIERESVLAWSIVMQNISDGAKWDDYGPRTKRGIRAIGGIGQLKLATYRDLNFMRKHFLDYYQADNFDAPLPIDEVRAITNES